MIFSINKGELQNALNIVSKGVSARSTQPVLSGVLIEAGDDTIVMRTTDLEMSIQFEVAALVEEKGKGVVPCKLFGDIIKSLPDYAIRVELGEEEANITCDASSFSIRALTPDEFPEFPHVEASSQIAVPFDKFSSMVRRVSRAVSRDESRPILTGILIEAEGDTLRLVATDSYRLAVTSANVPGAAGDFSAVISGNFLSDLAALPKSGEDIVIAVSDNQIVVDYQNTVFINRRIEGSYPPYRQLIPAGYTMRMEIPTSEFSQAVKRAALMGSSGSSMKVSADPDGGFIQLSATTQDVGSVRETLNCSGEGEATEIAFNCSYVIDGLSAVESDMVYLETQSSNRPGILRAIGGDEYWYLVMPVRIS